MQVISPVRPKPRATLNSRLFSDALAAIGTTDYDRACLSLFENFDAEHWAMFRYRPDRSIYCVATASALYEKAALVNIDRFVNRFHTVDPSFDLVPDRSGSECVTKIEIDDICDDQYRSCFRRTHVHERLSYFHWSDSNLYQLSIFRGPRAYTYSTREMTEFGTLASLVLATAPKHENLKRKSTAMAQYLDFNDVERNLRNAPTKLSEREREVCAKAAIGKTIEGTALDLGIKWTTVVTYRQRAYQKLGITSQVELVALVNNLRMQ